MRNVTAALAVTLTLALSACSDPSPIPYSGPGPGPGATGKQIDTFGLHAAQSGRTAQLAAMAYGTSGLQKVVALVQRIPHWVFHDCAPASEMGANVEGCVWYGQAPTKCEYVEFDAEVLNGATTGRLAGWGSGDEATASSGRASC